MLHMSAPHYQIKIVEANLTKQKACLFMSATQFYIYDHSWEWFQLSRGVKSVLMDASTYSSLSITPLIPISGFMLDEKFEIKQHEMKMVKNRAKFEAFRWNIFSSINKSRNWGAQQSTYFKMGHGVFIYKPTILKKGKEQLTSSLKNWDIHIYV